MSSVYRDGINCTIDPGSKIKTYTTHDGHVIESWVYDGKRIFFANLANSVYCAHGESEAQAIGDAIWKDPARRPSMNALVAEIKPDILTRKITVREFQLLTGACATGCSYFLSERKLPADSAMTLAEFLPIGGEWAKKLESVLT